MTIQRLQELRQEIDGVDDQILELLNRRAEMVIEVGRTKQQSQGEFYVPSREKAIYERLVSSNSGPFPADGLRRVFREIISASLSLEQPLKVAFLGPQATYTHVAAMQQFGLSAQLVPLKSISSIFDEVARGRASYGVVPVENSNEGVVSHTLDMFMTSEQKIIAEILLEVSHDLLNLSGRVEEIRRVVSHPQALGQCRHVAPRHASIGDVALKHNVIGTGLPVNIFVIQGNKTTHIHNAILLAAHGHSVSI